MARKDYHHPFQPYDIQQQFMEALYGCIENGNVGIFESPTGTGKSLSLICGSLSWLRDHKRKQFDEAVPAVEVDDDEPEWIVQHAREARRNEIRLMRTEFEMRLSAVRDRERKAKEQNARRGQFQKRQKRETDEHESSVVDDDQYLLDDYEQNGEGRPSTSKQSSYSSETTSLMEQLGMLPREKHHEDADTPVDEVKIFFCSRTHSQLTQVVGELQRVRLPPGLPPEPGAAADAVEELKHLSLGSRKNLCINPKVSRLGTQTAINERCLELQQDKTSDGHKCPFLPNKESEHLVLDFRDHALSQVRDIEDLAAVGAKLGICPYYASRSAIAPAEMVTLPYPLLLQKSARTALGISLKGHVVIIDEAHNLMSAVEGLYSTQISDVQLKRAKECIIIYLSKFRNRLKGSNRVYCTQLVRVVDAMITCASNLASQAGSGGTVDASALINGKNVDQINLADLVRYISDSKLARKVDSYVAHLAQSETNLGARNDNLSETPTLMQVQSFLTTLVNPSAEGRFFWSRESNAVMIRYMLLDPSEHFREIVEEARAVILAGGTMSPMDDYRQQLFPYLPSLFTFSCGHLIPTSSLFVRPILADVDGPLVFSYKARSDPSTAVRIGNAVRDVASIVKGGLVIFFPSYTFLTQVVERWQALSTLADLSSIKPVFVDGQTVSAEATFKAYSEAIANGSRGAILLSVLGGKLSEGINFSDNLGRCVVVVGLPFPNLETPEWKAKMQYIDDKAVASGAPRGKASREHAENVCMRSVNQAIGRVIRHKNDWASILLMDSRYGDKRIRAKLPGWIKESFSGAESGKMGEVTTGLAEFFAGSDAGQDSRRE